MCVYKKSRFVREDPRREAESVLSWLHDGGGGLIVDVTESNVTYPTFRRFEALTAVIIFIPRSGGSTDRDIIAPIGGSWWWLLLPLLLLMLFFRIRLRRLFNRPRPPDMPTATEPLYFFHSLSTMELGLLSRSNPRQSTFEEGPEPRKKQSHLADGGG